MRPRGAVWQGAVVALVMACRPTGALFAQDALSSADRCIAPVAYYPLDGAVVGLDSQGVPALGTYERISPDGRFILRSYSGKEVGTVSLMELPEKVSDAVRVYRTPFSNEAFPVQGSWRYLVDVSGEHYRFTDVLRDQSSAKPLFRAGMTGFYAAASELPAQDPAKPSEAAKQTFFIRSLSWPQNADSDAQGVGPLQLETVEVRDDSQTARVISKSGPQFICSHRESSDGNVFALPMISVDGLEFSAIPQSPKQGQPTMRVYGLGAAPNATSHPCDLRADLGFSPGKAVFGYPAASAAPAWLTYSDLGSVYVFDRALKATFRLDHTRERTLVSAFPGLTRDGRVVYGATWRECRSPGKCTEQAGYVVSDPYQSQAYRAFWQQRGSPAPKVCITQGEVSAERARFARARGLGDRSTRVRAAP